MDDHLEDPDLPVATVAASLAYRLLAEGTVTQVAVAAL
jgi:hypothetical protein